MDVAKSLHCFFRAPSHAGALPCGCAALNLAMSGVLFSRAEPFHHFCDGDAVRYRPANENGEVACRVDFPSRRADFEGVPCHSGNLDLQDHIVGACDLEGASAHTFPSQKTQSFAQRPRNPFPFGQIALFANSLNEFSRILPAEDEFACSFANEVDGNLLADQARRDRRHVSARGVGCRKGALFSSSRSCQSIECRHRPSIFATMKMSMAPP